MVPTLYTYICRNCKMTLTVSVREGQRWCPACASYMRYSHEAPVTTAEQMDVYKQGQVFGGMDQPQPWTCVRCGTEVRGVRPRWRVDGRCCQACVEAEHRPTRLLTDAEIEADRARREAVAQEDQDRLEAAYQAAEAKR